MKKNRLLQKIICNAIEFEEMLNLKELKMMDIPKLEDFGKSFPNKTENYRSSITIMEYNYN